jgi:hypothetical protein
LAFCAPEKIGIPIPALKKQNCYRKLRWDTLIQASGELALMKNIIQHPAGFIPARQVLAYRFFPVHKRQK